MLDAVVAVTRLPSARQGAICVSFLTKYLGFVSSISELATIESSNVSLSRVLWLSIEHSGDRTLKSLVHPSRENHAPKTERRVLNRHVFVLCAGARERLGLFERAREEPRRHERPTLGLGAARVHARRPLVHRVGQIRSVALAAEPVPTRRAMPVRGSRVQERATRQCVCVCARARE